MYISMMPRKPIPPNPENCSLAELDAAMRAAASRKSYKRMMALRILLLGHAPADVALMFNVCSRTISDWIKKFNERGIDGLLERPRSGRPPRISAGNGKLYLELLNQPQQADVVHWTGRKFHGYICRELQHDIGYSTLLRWMHEKDYRLKVPRPWPDRQDEEKRELFIERLQEFLKDENVELWYGDEMGVEGDPRPRRRWARKGEKVRVARNGEHIRMNVTGAVCPRTGAFYALEFSHSDRVTFQVFLEHANQDLEFERSHNLFICDNASWHKSKALSWGRFEPLFLPPYSPDLNPIERLWLIIKAEWFSDFTARNHEQLIERLDRALCWAIDRKQENQKTCSIRKEL